MLSLILQVLMILGTSPTPFSGSHSAYRETVQPNDNRTPAGTRTGNVLTVSLEARSGMWYPEGPRGRGLEVAAWAEPGRPMQTPGPLIRVVTGTTVRATLRNSLTRRLYVFGFGTKRGLADSVIIEPGAERQVQFVATEPGTFYYMARGQIDPALGIRSGEDAQLNGAIVIDPPGAASNDRVFLISWWFTLDSTSRSGLGRATMTMNGLSWPHTERIDMVQGDSAYWRVINLTEAPHPMHLHGFYFQMRSKGNGFSDSLYTPAQRRLAVTEVTSPFQTMSLAWSPTRPGNWIYHCHFVGHVSHHASLDSERGEFSDTALVHHGSDRPHQMFGLVLGITVAPKGPIATTTRASHRIQLVIREKSNAFGRFSAYAYALGGTPAAMVSSPLPAPPGPTLVLTRNEPVAVTIVNRSTERAAVHWHGIELESYPDGVPDWSGYGKEILPSVAPGDSITVRFTPPRAGTFMYHSHFNEESQISGGLYGPIVVMEPGKRFDPATDRIMFFSSAGPWENQIAGPVSPTLLNGEKQPGPVELRTGTKYRLRLINMTGDVDTQVQLLENGRPGIWRAVAKDGATLPAVQATQRPAALVFHPGEIWDFEYTAGAPGNLVLHFGPPDAPPAFGWPKRVDVPVVVRR
jgi:FtsP/CotA-like multicopper oxidase with cupredoxin domain